MKKFLILILPFLLISCIETIAITSFGSAYLMSRSKSVKDSITDTKITAILTKEIKYGADSKNNKNLRFNSYQGRVMLTGSYQDQNAFNKLKQKIWEIDGVKEVINETITSKNSKLSILVDYYIATKIKTTFILKKNIKAFDINIEVYNQNVYLIGNVEDESSVKIAAQAAAKISKVKKVTSFLRAI